MWIDGYRDLSLWSIDNILLEAKEQDYSQKTNLTHKTHKNPLLPTFITMHFHQKASRDTFLWERDEEGGQNFCTVLVAWYGHDGKLAILINLRCVGSICCDEDMSTTWGATTRSISKSWWISHKIISCFIPPRSNRIRETQMTERSLHHFSGFSGCYIDEEFLDKHLCVLFRLYRIS